MKYKKFINKKLKEYVKTNIDKGYSLDNIKKGLVSYGYDPLFAEKLINNYIIKNHIYRYIAVISLVIIFSFSLIKPTITGYAILTKYSDYADNLDLVINESSEYIWNLENKGDIESIKLTGSIIGDGYAKIYIENKNKKYLIYDTKKEIRECTFIDLLYSLIYFKENKTRCVSYKKLYSSFYSFLRKGVPDYKPVISFKETCIETCSLTDFNKDSYKLIFEINNAELKLNTMYYTIKITYENHPPNSTFIPDITWNEDDIYELNLSKYFFDIDKDILEYTSTEPEDIAVNINKEGIATLKPKQDWHGYSSIIFSAIDPGELKAVSNNVFLTVININDVPVIKDVNLISTDESKRTNGDLIADYTPYDADNDSITTEIKWYKGYEELTYLANKTLVSSENTNKGEEWLFHIRVYDGLNWSSIFKSNKIKIQNTIPKIIPIGSITANNDEEFVFNALAIDRDLNDKTDILIWHINDTKLDMDFLTGLINDTPKENEAGTYSILINVSDGTAYDKHVFNYTIKDITAPRWSDSKISKQLIRVNDDVEFSTKWEDSFLDYYFFSTNDSGRWINYSSKNFDITTNISKVTNKTISTRGKVVGWKFYAKDKSNNIGETKTFTFTVANTDPILFQKILNITWNEDTDLLNKINLDNYFLDADKDILEYSVIGNSIINIMIDENNEVSFTQPTDWHGNESVVFTASDGITTIRSDDIMLTVKNVPDCGKDGCEPGESCLTCPPDCGECIIVNETALTENISKTIKPNETTNITREENITKAIEEFLEEEKKAKEKNISEEEVKPVEEEPPPELEEELIEIEVEPKLILELSEEKKNITKKIGNTSISPSQIEINPIPCVRSTKIVEKGEIGFEEIDVSALIKIPRGYETIIPPFKIKCKGELLVPTISIPENYDDVGVLKCKEDECNLTKVVQVDELKCGGEIVESYKKEKYLKPEFMPIEIEETSLSFSSFEEALESGNNKVRFYGEAFESISATLAMPKESVAEAENPSLKIIGTPLMLKIEKTGETPVSSIISMPYVEEEGFDESTIAMYVRDDNKWKYLGGTLDKQSKIVTADIANVTDYLNENNEVQFALMGIICVNCLSSSLTNIYKPITNTRDAVILVHGLMSSPATYQNIINDIRLTNQPWQVWIFGYPTDRKTEVNAKELSDHLQSNTDEYDNIYIITHSLGGLIAQKALYDAYNENKKDPGKYDYIKKVKKVILIATPNKGSPAAELYQNLFNHLINLKSAYNLFNPNSIVLEQLTKGLITPRVPTIGYYVIAGTKTYEFNAVFFKITTAELFEKYEPNDGIVAVSSAQYVGDNYINDTCNNYWEIKETHTSLLDKLISRSVIERIIAQEILEVLEEEKIPIIGHYKYFNMFVEECSPDETYIIIGKKVRKEKVFDPTGCLCGNGYCGEGEDQYNCPSDCLNIFRKEIIILSLPYILGVILSLLMFILYKKVKRFHDLLHRLIGKIKNLPKIFRKIKLTEKEKAKEVKKLEKEVKIKLEKIEETFLEKTEKGGWKLKETLKKIISKILEFLKIKKGRIKEEKKYDEKLVLKRHAVEEIPEKEEIRGKGIFRKLLSKIANKLKRKEKETKEEGIQVKKVSKLLKLFKKKEVEEEAEEEIEVKSHMLTLYSLLIFVGIAVIIISLIYTKLVGVVIGISIIIFSIIGYKTTIKIYGEEPPEI